MKITPYDARKAAVKEHQERQTREAVKAIRAHKGFGKRPNYVREAAFGRAGRIGE